MRMKEVLKKENCLATIGDKPVRIIDNAK